ncbi:hypothetical protein TCAL_10139 [Tigriopus californicus]|uniref:Uncharacterized protein n=2 Tax=Tigriopus californicus TaxID=6832 RepID=A0A553PEU1_TIGCA|nr:hypothetical protein TCAL_10139 [Tigriopus californicus]
MDSIEFNPQILIATLIGVSLAGLWGGLTPNLLDQCPKSLQTGFTFFSSGSVLALLFGQVIPQLFYDIKQFHAPIPVELLCGMVIVFGKLSLQLVALLFPGSLGQISQKPSSHNPNLWTTVEDSADSNDDDTNELHYFLSPDHCEAPRPR